MIGVDLSKEMIEKARLRQCYDKLVCGNLEDVLLPQSPSTSPCNSTFSYDLVIAADVFVYIGDLQSIFTLAQKRLTPGYGLFLFSTEMLEDTAGDRPFLLQSCARFSHKKSYLIQLCKSSGLHLIDIQSSIIRQNQGVDVVGYLVIVGS
jgi:predicted TPR repeat methyltransferase